MVQFAASPFAEHVFQPPLRVLVVEDDNDTADTTAELLRLHGYKAEVARDGRAALQSAATQPPDVVLLDLALPGLNGYEVAGELQRQVAGKRPLLIALTGYCRDVDRSRSRAAGIDLYLLKPIHFSNLQRILIRFQDLIDSTTPSERREELPDVFG